MLSFQRNNAVGWVFTVFLTALLALVGFHSTGPDLANYQAFESGELNGHFSVQLYINALRLFGLTRFFGVESVVIAIYFLLALRLLICASGSLIRLLLFTLVFFLSYESIALFGNVLRQGFSVFIFCMLYPWKSKSKISGFRKLILTFLVLIHPSALFNLLGILILSRRLELSIFKVDKKSLFLVVTLLIITLSIFGDYLFSRLQVVLNRDFQNDLLGYCYALFLFCVSFLLTRLSGINPTKNYQWLLVVLLVTVFFGEFGQRLLIGLSFSITYFVLVSGAIRPPVCWLLLMAIASSMAIIVFQGNYFFGVLG